MASINSVHRSLRDASRRMAGEQEEREGSIISERTQQEGSVVVAESNSTSRLKKHTFHLGDNRYRQT